jgi:hypothetical protein
MAQMVALIRGFKFLPGTRSVDFGVCRGSPNKKAAIVADGRF